MHITVEHDIRIQIQKLIRDLRHHVCKKADQCIRRAVCRLVRTSGEVFFIKAADINYGQFISVVIAFDRFTENLFLNGFKRNVILLDGGKVHRKHKEVERLLRIGTHHHRERTGEHPVKNTGISTEKNVKHGPPLF